MRALRLAHAELDAAVPGPVLGRVVGGPRPRRPEAYGLQPVRVGPGLDEVGRHGLGALDGETLIVVGAAFDIGVALDGDAQAGTDLGGLGEAVEGREARGIERGTVAVELDRAGAGDPAQVL